MVGWWSLILSLGKGGAQRCTIQHSVVHYSNTNQSPMSLSLSLVLVGWWPLFLSLRKGWRAVGFVCIRIKSDCSLLSFVEWLQNINFPSGSREEIVANPVFPRGIINHVVQNINLGRSKGGATIDMHIIYIHIYRWFGPADQISWNPIFIRGGPDDPEIGRVRGRPVSQLGLQAHRTHVDPQNDRLPAWPRTPKSKTLVPGKPA